MRKFDEDSALAVVFANTRRKKRTEDLTVVADAFEFLARSYGSNQAVAKKVGLSAEMVREFRKLCGLSEPVKQLVRSRAIDNLDVAYRIAMVTDARTQLAMAKEATGLQSDDVRDVRRLVSRTGLTPASSKRKVIASKLKGLHVFMMDFDDAQYREILRQARLRNLDPAEMVKRVIADWLAKTGQRPSGKTR